MTRRDDLPRFANVRDGGNLPARPGLIRTVIGGGLLFLAVSWGALALIMLMGGA